MQTKNIEYYDDKTLLQGYLVYDEKDKKPVVIIFHDWTGNNSFAQHKAKAMMELGYAGFAVDMYGKGILGDTVEEKSDLIRPFLENRSLLRQRALAAYETVKKLSEVDTNRIAAIGFCFGGMCALDLARTGVDLRGVVSFHGFFNSPQGVSKEKINAKILALHGYQDPMVSQDEVIMFEKEMTENNVDWQIHIFGYAKHAFMNPAANDAKLGTVYHEPTSKRAWLEMKNFFAEIF
jgi:dienelactone hydrolase